MKEVKVKLILTDGYEKRFTEACLNQLRKREQAAQLKNESGRKAG